jgi:hypothetical protein
MNYEEAKYYYNIALERENSLGDKKNLKLIPKQ